MAYDLSFMQKIIVPRNKYHSVPQICKENCAKKTYEGLFGTLSFRKIFFKKVDFMQFG